MAGRRFPSCDFELNALTQGWETEMNIWTGIFCLDQGLDWKTTYLQRKSVRLPTKPVLPNAFDEF